MLPQSSTLGASSGMGCFAVLRSMVCLSAALLVGGGGVASAAEPLPRELSAISVDEHLGAQVDLGLKFTDVKGAQVSLGEVLGEGRPTLLTLNYFRCGTLCGVQLNGLLDGLREIDSPTDAPLHVVTVSIDPREGPELATIKKNSYLEALGRQDIEWDFLTGEEASIRALADAVGFSYSYDASSDQFAHPAVLTFLAPDGKVARYLYGIDYAARDLRFAFLEASEGRAGSPIDKLVLSCFRYDSGSGRYTPAAFGVMRLGGVLTMLGMAGLGLVLWRQDHRVRRNRSSS